ncbi:hypothetical protein [Janibacter sp. LM]|uniref:hypothetical protein n=1 Tax=Janibacter sp. LM TaxID=3144845 RepID=UPI0031F6D7A4
MLGLEELCQTGDDRLDRPQQVQVVVVVVLPVPPDEEGHELHATPHRQGCDLVDAPDLDAADALGTRLPGLLAAVGASRGGRLDGAAAEGVEQRVGGAGDAHLLAHPTSRVRRGGTTHRPHGETVGRAVDHEAHVGVQTLGQQVDDDLESLVRLLRGPPHPGHELDHRREGFGGGIVRHAHQCGGLSIQ